MSALFENFYGDVLVVRTPSPITFNKAGANYKSEVPHLEYSPRAAYQEWLAICDAILELGGDALFVFEDADEIFLDRADLTVDAQGAIKSGAEVLGHVDQAQTGRGIVADERPQCPALAPRE